jgi:hypothetical protein
MKLRFDKNSVRLRVKKSDLQMLREKKSIFETVHFPGSSFDYQLSISDSSSEVSACMKGQSIEVTLPSGIAMTWINNDETGIYHTVNFGNNHSLGIIIEKDFPCKGQPEADQSDSFNELSERNKSKLC